MCIDTYTYGEKLKNKEIQSDNFMAKESCWYNVSVRSTMDV